MAVRLRLFRAHRRLREKLNFLLQPRKDRQALAAAPTRAQLRPAECKHEDRIPLPAFAEFACGD